MSRTKNKKDDIKVPDVFSICIKRISKNATNIISDYSFCCINYLFYVQQYKRTLPSFQ